jgi:hypothetical protein
MPDVVPVWSMELPNGAGHRVAVTDDEAGEIALKMMRRRMAEVKGLDAGS